MELYNQYKVDVPEGREGRYEIKRFEVSQEDEKFGRLRAMIGSSDRGRFTPSGTYTGLYRYKCATLDGDNCGTFGKEILMSDTPDEIRDHLGFIRRAKGRVLINGLGLGMAARACLLKPEVESVTVIELARDVIHLVHPWLQAIAGKVGTQLTVINADALYWKMPKSWKGVRWDAVWHDIWDNICADNLPDMHRLHRRFGGRCDWQGSWCREVLER
jgi:hypothetical protein